MKIDKDVLRVLNESDEFILSLDKIKEDLLQCLNLPMELVSNFNRCLVNTQASVLKVNMFGILSTVQSKVTLNYSEVVKYKKELQISLSDRLSGICCKVPAGDTLWGAGFNNFLLNATNTKPIVVNDFDTYQTALLNIRDALIESAKFFYSKMCERNFTRNLDRLRSNYTSDSMQLYGMYTLNTDDGDSGTGSHYDEFMVAPWYVYLSK